MFPRAPWASPNHSAIGLCSHSTRDTIQWSSGQSYRGVKDVDVNGVWVSNDNNSSIEYSLKQLLDVLPHCFDEKRDYISSMVLHMDFYSKKMVT